MSVTREQSMGVVVSDVTDHGEHETTLLMGNGDNMRRVIEKLWLDGKPRAWC